MSLFEANSQVREAPQFDAITQYIEDGIQRTGDALNAFCEPIEDRYMATSNPSEIEGLLWSAWRCVVVSAAATDHEYRGQQKLVDFIFEVQRRPTLEKDGQACEVQGMTVWRDLPILVWEMREAWNASASDDSDQDSRRRWININAWTAKLVASAHSVPKDHSDMSLYCIWTVRAALEDHQQPSYVALAAASVWFIYAAPTVWDFCEQGKTFDGKVAKPGALFSDNDWRGFTKDRWRAWEERLSDLQGQISDDHTEKLIEQAKKAMNNILKQ